MINNQTKKWAYFLVFLLILLTGSFFRGYNFSNWLHFETDQVDDIIVVSEGASKGVANLPLLGPVAAGGPLRLGPLFYYIEYFGAIIFGNTPPGHASVVLIFSVLAIIVFYYFLLRYFSKRTALALLAIFAFSTYLIVYSRFSWNPNLLPFFFISMSYALLRSVSREEKNKERWFIIAIILATFATQMHFNAFFVVPLFFFFFLIIKRPDYNWRIWIIAIGIVLTLYAPVVLNDIKTHGSNFRNLSEKFIGKPNKEKKTNMAEKLIQITRYNAYEYFLVISGVDQINNGHPKNSSFGLTCDSCVKNLPWRLTALLFLGASLFLLAINLFKEKDSEKRNFLIVIFLWFSSSSLYFFLILSNGMYLYPRFFLLPAPVAIIFLGFIVEFINPGKGLYRFIFCLFVIVPLIFLNAQKTKKYFDDLAKGAVNIIQIETEDVFPNMGRITLNQQIAVINYIETKYRQNNYPIYIKSESEYEPAFWYHLKSRGISNYDKIKNDAVYAEGNYFLILRSTLIKEKNLEKYNAKFIFNESKKFGSITVYYLTPKSEFITGIIQDFTKDISTAFSPRSMGIMRWKDLFSTPAH